MRQESGLVLIEDYVLPCYVLGAMVVVALLYSNDWSCRLITRAQNDEDAVLNTVQAFEFWACLSGPMDKSTLQGS